MAINDWNDDFDDADLDDWDYKPKKAVTEKQPGQQGKKKPSAGGRVELHSTAIKCPSCGANIETDPSLQIRRGQGSRFKDGKKRGEGSVPGGGRCGKGARKEQEALRKLRGGDRSNSKKVLQVRAQEQDSFLQEELVRYNHHTVCRTACNQFLQELPELRALKVIQPDGRFH